jgi:large subunit ribosomal protein L6
MLVARKWVASTYVKYGKGGSVSRIGKTPIVLPPEVEVKIDGSSVQAKGKLGELKFSLPPGISATQEENKIILDRKNDSREQKSFHGLSRALVQNIINGVDKGYEKELQIIGTGYTAEMYGKWLRIAVGYSHDILMEVPEHIQVEATQIPRREQGKLGIQAVIKVRGIHKEDVGKIAAEIRACRKPENYKGKGIRYAGEYVKIKAGKAGA